MQNPRNISHRHRRPPNTKRMNTHFACDAPPCPSSPPSPPGSHLRLQNCWFNFYVIRTQRERKISAGTEFIFGRLDRTANLGPFGALNAFSAFSACTKQLKCCFNWNLVETICRKSCLFAKYSSQFSHCIFVIWHRARNLKQTNDWTCNRSPPQCEKCRMCRIMTTAAWPTATMNRILHLLCTCVLCAPSWKSVSPTKKEQTNKKKQIRRDAFVRGIYAKRLC